MAGNRAPKRTTIILDERDREYLDRLIREGKEPGIKPFISKMFDMYRDMSVHEWKYPGEYYSGVSRIAFFSQENLSALLGAVPKQERRNIGRKMGEATSLSIGSSLGVDTRKRESWPQVFERLRVFGYGDLALRDGVVVAKNPFIGDLDALQGFLEGLLGAGLDAKTTMSPIILEVKAQAVAKA